MHRRTARGNRLGLLVTGVLLTAAGIALFLAHQGRLGAGRHDPLYPLRARTFVHDTTSWFWPAVAAAAVLVGLVFLRWLLVQPRTDRLRQLVIDTDDADADADADVDAVAGRTRMPAHALTDVVEDDIEALPGVRRVSAALTGHPDAPELWLTVSTGADADLARIRHAITTDVLGDVRACLDLPELPTYLYLTLARRDVARDVR